MSKRKRPEPVIVRQDVRVPPSPLHASQIRIEYGTDTLVLRVESRARFRVRKAFLLTIYRELKKVLREMDKIEFFHSDSRSWLSSLRNPVHSPNFYQLPKMDSHGKKMGLKLRVKRNRLGLTQVQLAKLAKVTPEHLSKIEHGHHAPRAATIERIESALRRFKPEPTNRVPGDKPQVTSQSQVGLNPSPASGASGATGQPPHGSESLHGSEGSSEEAGAPSKDDDRATQDAGNPPWEWKLPLPADRPIIWRDDVRARAWSRTPGSTLATWKPPKRDVEEELRQLEEDQDDWDPPTI